MLKGGTKMIGIARNATLHLDNCTPYLRLGKYLYDPSGKNASILYKSLNKEDMKKHLLSNYTKEDVVTMLLDFVDASDEYQNFTA